jgi:DNA phosphorothioation system restriction enzyme
MRLATLEIPAFLDSSSANLVDDFFVPALLRSVAYDRGVGYFTSGWIRQAAAGMVGFVENGGKARWVTSPILDESDWDALRAGDEARADDALRRSLQRSVADFSKSLEEDTLSALAWMVADGVLDFRLALPREKLAGGEFHDKFGIFTDEDGNRLAFNGSYNDSLQGSRNYESLKIFKSWDPAFAPLVEQDALRFERLWNDQDPNVRCYPLPDAIREEILKLRPSQRPYRRPETTEVDRLLDGDKEPYIAPGTIPAWLKLFEHQKLAIEAWLKHGIPPLDPSGRRGIFAMATGSGKTLTALVLACRLAAKNTPFVLIVTCPFINLAEQWIREMKKFGLQAVPCFKSRKIWQSRLAEGYQRLDARLDPILPIVVTNDTLGSPAFQQALRLQTATHLIVADEVHSLGGTHAASSLPKGIRLRLGLSATPRRHMDEEGTQQLFNYFGDIVYEFGLAEAIKADCLTPYDYHPILVTLDPDEAEEYEQLTKRLSRLFDENGKLQEAAKPLLMRRARLLGQARQKITALEDILKTSSAMPEKSVFYCGDGRVDDPITEDERRQIDAVARLLGERYELRVRTFTYRESPSEREEILDGLRQGSLDGVVAIRCLDEGIDVPELRTGFLMASSTNPRQFIQRRGRLLRKAKGKHKAIIYDFIVIPPDLDSNMDGSGFNMERNLFRRELSRIVEFCETAENGPEAMGKLLDLRRQYNLLAM